MNSVSWQIFTTWSIFTRCRNDVSRIQVSWCNVSSCHIVHFYFVVVFFLYFLHKVSTWPHNFLTRWLQTRTLYVLDHNKTRLVPKKKCHLLQFKQICRVSRPQTVIQALTRSDPSLSWCYTEAEDHAEELHCWTKTRVPLVSGSILLHSESPWMWRHFLSFVMCLALQLTQAGSDFGKQ